MDKAVTNGPNQMPNELVKQKRAHGFNYMEEFI